MKTVALILFIYMCIFMIVFGKRRHYIAILVSLAYIILGITPLNKVVPAIDFNVIMMLGGMMILVYYFIESKMPSKIADKLLDISPNIMWVVILMCVFASLISTFIDNTATILMVAPIGIEICKKLKINPVPMILSIAFSSNLQSEATLVGDATSVMLSSAAKLDFNDFFILNGRPSIFFAVELGALASLIVIGLMFKKYKHEVHASNDIKVNNYFPSIMLIVLIILLIIVSFIPTTNKLLNGLICMIIGLTVMLEDTIRNKEPHRVLNDLKSIDYSTLIMLVCLFIIVKGLTEIGLVGDLAGAITRFGNGNKLYLYLIIMIGSFILSGFIDNIPYVMAMLPVAGTISSSLSITPYLLYFGLIIGATLGGNLTPIGTSSNIVTMGLLKNKGYNVKYKDFIKVSLPITLSAFIASGLFVWMVWS